MDPASGDRGASRRRDWRWLFPLAALGIFFRLNALHHPFYGHDEAYTSLHVAGYDRSDLRRELFHGGEVTVAQLRRFQEADPSRGIRKTVRSVAEVDPRHPPLFYAAARAWAAGFGASAPGLRSLAALFSCLALPLVYWLGRELFGRGRAASVAVALLALSPFQVLFAREARPYSLLAAATLLASLMLLRALRQPTRGRWLLYAATVALGLYSHTLFALVLLAHGLAVLAARPAKAPGARASRRLDFAVAALLGLLPFLPWLALLVYRLPLVVRSGAWAGESVPFAYLVNWWTFGLAAQFFDLNQVAFSFPALLARLPFLLVEGFALAFLWRRAPRPAAVFVAALIAGATLPFLLPDLLLGGLRSAVPRFLVPGYLGVQLAVAFLLGTALDSERPRWRAAGWVTLAALLAAGAASCGAMTRATDWWHHPFRLNEPSHVPEVARLLARAHRPTVISDFTDVNPGHLLTLARVLPETIGFRLAGEGSAPDLPADPGECYVFHPSAGLRQDLKARGWVLEPFYPPGALWRLRAR